VTPRADDIVGKLAIRLTHDGERVTGVNIDSSRPLRVARLLEGKPVDAALKLVPLLYTICGESQAAAAVSACEQALGLEVEPTQQRARRILLDLETLREHLWRVFVDWPKVLRLKPRPEWLAPLLSVQTTLRGVVSPSGSLFGLGGGEIAMPPATTIAKLHALDQHLVEHLFGSEAAALLAGDRLPGPERGGMVGRCLAELSGSEWLSLEGELLPALEELTDAQWHALLDGEDAFLARPEIDNQPRETSPLTRQRQHPLVQRGLEAWGPGPGVRLLARAVEVTAVLRRLQVNVARLGGARPFAQTRAPGGRGLGIVEAARGRLVHQLDQRDGRVTRYRILAPTEWNLHPRGVLARALLRLEQPRPSGLRALVKVLVTAVDPCVDWQLELRSGELSAVG
jgi:hypothetical protein